MTFKGIRKSDGREVEQTLPVEAATPNEIPAATASLLQTFIGVTGLVCKDPTVPRRISFIPIGNLNEVWCDIPSIVIVDGLEGQSLIKP